MSCVTFRNKLSFYGEDSSAPRPSPQPDYNFLSAARDCLFNTFAGTEIKWILRNLINLIYKAHN
jgi:hypothetical protein